jgi:hypothetical protein
MKLFPVVHFLLKKKEKRCRYHLGYGCSAIRTFSIYSYSKQRIQSHARTKKRKKLQNQIPDFVLVKKIGFINQNGVYSKL